MGQDGAENKYVYRSVVLEVAALLEFDNKKVQNRSSAVNTEPN